MALIPTFLIKVIELIDSSESDDSTDEEDECVLFCLNKIRVTPSRSIPRCKNYMDVVHSFTDDEFKKHFRMKQSTFNFILELLRPELCKQNDKSGRHPITPEKQLLLAIWFMSTPNSYRCVSDRFDVGTATA
ncbi:uncharacterized protein LOC112459839 [Temnothorax curvispinosus]|uniref:Uncharacterized protein LOC112459839 n=1 Tax=Temnothorax curvispinosus TaxID=300111 RepID=A0A6J1QH15_9HYME|nr:uncharacterized protein LOC112459839 [Temnothorax curvispinosus]